MDRLLELAERCEKASGPDREMDGAIKAALQIGQEWTRAYPEASRVWAVSYTASLDAAMTLAPEGPNGSNVYPRIARVTPDAWEAHLGFGNRAVGSTARAATPALALCAAALRARASQDPRT